MHGLEADRSRAARAAPRDVDGALGDVLGEVADALEVAGDADRRDDLAQVDRHRLAPRDGQDRVLLDLALQRSRRGSTATVRARGRRRARQRVHRVRQHLLGDAAHLGDLAAEQLEFLVVGSDDVIGHGGQSCGDQPKRPVM